MITIKSNDELKTIIRDGEIVFHDDVTFKCDININTNITAWNITAWDITARNITARGDITARNITAWDITARGNITARDISFYALCFAYGSLLCKSITGRRQNSKFGCLDGEVEYIKDEPSLSGKMFQVVRSDTKYVYGIFPERSHAEFVVNRLAELYDKPTFVID